MSWSKFGLGFLLVIFVTYAKTRLVNYWVPIEFSTFLIFFVVRSSSMSRALAMTFVLTMGMDFIFQTGQIKGIQTMAQLLLVFGLVTIKKHVIPQLEDVVLMGFFAIFFVCNHYLTVALSKMLGVYVETVATVLVLFFALFHTALFGFLLAISHRLQRGES